MKRGNREGVDMVAGHGKQERRPCVRCRTTTVQVRDNETGGWYCTRCKQYEADPDPSWRAAVGWSVAFALLVLAVKAILTVVPAP